MKKYLKAIATQSTAKFEKKVKYNFQKTILIGVLFLAFNGNITRLYGQSCPPNLNFSSGYPDWNYYSGTCSATGTGPYTWSWTAEGSTPPSATITQTVNASSNISTAYTSVVVSGYDYYGGFPVVPPPMAGFTTPTTSLLLNGPLCQFTTSKAEYVFTPSDYGIKTLAYQYAVVLQNPDSGEAGYHAPNQMPRFGIYATDTITGDTIGCVNFTYVTGIYAGSPVPFIRSSVIPWFNDDNNDVFYLPWQAGSINLSQVPSGDPIRVVFEVGSCTKYFGHFGYAYIDMACRYWPDTVYACYPGTDTLPVPPPGFETYDWYQGSTLIDTGRVPPVVTVLSTPTVYMLAMQPYPGFGCPDTLTVTLMPLPTPTITGTLSVCKGLTTDLSSSVSGGTWSSSTTTVATIGTSGIVNGLSVGTSTITYKLLSTGCFSTVVVTVNPSPDPISGTLIVCAGSTISLSDTVTGGTWSSTNTTVGTVGSTTGVVTGIAGGTTTISYKLSDGCLPATVVVTVNPLPTTISGVKTICAGSTTTLSDGVSGGTWSSTNTTVGTVGSTTGVVSGISPGTTTISYTLTDGCGAVATVVTVNPSPAAINGSTYSLCIGTTTTFSDTVAGGTWSSSNTGIATVGSTTGIVTGVGSGWVTISYTIGDGCFATFATYVAQPPAAIIGTDVVCVGMMTDLTDVSAGGYWTSSNTSIATVGFSTGVVTGVATGTVIISYTGDYLCPPATVVVTVNASPDSITGTLTMCTGNSTVLSDTIGGGSWSSSNTGVAAVLGLSGAISPTATIVGVSAGTAIITYMFPTGCYATVVVTVLPTAAAITGTASVCVGATTSLTDTPVGGTWGSSNTAVATVGGTGIVTGVTVGTAYISYTFSNGCLPAGIVVTVNPSPGPITGADSVCVGASITLADTTSGGIWTSGNTAIATVGSITGVVTESTSGTVTISYTLTDGCYTTVTVTLNPLPLAITGVNNLCVGFSATLSDATVGGTWSSGTTSVATIGSGTGIIFAVSAGTTMITYTLSTGCITTMIVTVNPLPSVILGGTVVCAGLTISLSDITTGGTWSSSTTTVATIGSGTGIISAVGAGTTTISYVLPTGCYTTDVVTVNPAASSITGPTNVCEGATINLTDATSGGTWSSSNTGIATVGSSSGVVTGISPGSTTITYALGTGCIATKTIIVNPSPDPISGIDSICVGSATDLSDDTTGGTWSSSSTIVASVGSLTGIVLGNSAGTAIITYMLPGITAIGCYVTTTVTVNPLPLIITGPSVVCVSSAVTLTDATSGGSWSSGNTAIATVGSGTGIVTGVAAGTTTITYTLVTGCYRTRIETVNPTPSVITGADSVCVGFTTILSDSVSGGTWTSSDTTIATIDSSGNVTGVTVGTVTITYSFSTGCSATITVTVNPLPGFIADAVGVCVGFTDTLTDSPGGGIWTSGNTTIATVGSLTGIVTGVATGVTYITYTLSTGCYATVETFVSAPPGPITGPDSVCAGATITLNDTTLGGAWSSNNTSIATITPLGMPATVTGVASGSVLISYTMSTGCFVTDTIIVDSLPAIPSITGVPCASVLCEFPLRANPINPGLPINPFSPFQPFPQGVNSPSAAVATTLSSGLYVATTPLGGITSFGSQLGGLNGAGGLGGRGGGITNAPLAFPCVCIGSTTPLSDSVTGGIWGSMDTSVATVDSSGVVTGVSTGPVIITYSVINGCGTATVFTIVIVEGPPTVSVITGVLGVCAGYTTDLYDSVSCGVWSTNDTSIIAIDSSSGVVTGISSGSATVTYTVTNACGSASDSIQVVVDQVPYITTNFIVACQTLASGGGEFTAGHGSILPDTGCIDVCDSSIVRYYGNGNAGAMFTWSVIGGIVVNTYPPANDSIDIFWPTLGTTGSLTLIDTLGHCTGKTMACIKVIAKPHANFSVSAASVCLGEKILFTDYSTSDSSSPIVSWYWNFGDGGVSSNENPTYTYTASGTYTVTLIVKNACGCTDSMSAVITVSAYTGPTIACASIVCDSQRAIYSTTPDSCGIYEWSVIGGTIVSGDTTTASITVQWNAVGAGGFGYVSLVEPCANCNDTVTIKVPVILQSPIISGPSVLCAGQQYQFSFPLWAATQYQWGVIGCPGCIVGNRDNNIVTVDFLTPGTYTIHGWYQNRIALCGTSVDTTITVVPATAIVGPTSVCSGNEVTYTLADTTLSATWTLENDTTGYIYGSVTGTSLSGVVPAPGTYLIIATGNFCASPLTVSVLPAPPPIDSVTGPDIVCLNKVYSYTAWTDVTGTIYSWQAIGGTVSPASGSDVVSVVWTSSGTKQLLVSHMNTTPPYCNGPVDTINIIQEVINPNITGDTLPCANSYRTYNANYTRGDAYSWALNPNTAGSVVTGNYDSVISILWNNVTSITPVQIILTVQKCDTTVYDTLTVEVQPSMGLSITASPTPACPGAPVTFTTSSGGAMYYWDFGDGTGSFIPWPSGYTSPPHAFPPNTTTGNVTYTVKVTISPNSYAPCPASGVATYFMTILPGPVAVASTDSYCPGIIVGTVTDNVGGLTYQWYDNGSSISGAIASTYTATTEGYYNFVVTAGNGCTDTSNLVRQACPVTINDSGCIVGMHDTSYVVCNTVQLSASGTMTGAYWNMCWGPSMPVGGVIPATGAVATATFDTPGIYQFCLNTPTDSCGVVTFTQIDTVGIIVNFRYETKCVSSSTDSVFFTDYSTYLPWWVFTGGDITWYNGSSYLGTGSTLGVPLSAPGTYNIKEVVTGTDPGGTFSCETIKTIHIDGGPPPGVSFTYSVSPVCEGVPITFNAIGTGGPLTYYWSFGDGSSSALQNTQRTYTWPTLPNPYPFTATLTVTDTIGCTAIDTATVLIYHNTLTGGYAGIDALCSSAAPDTLVFGNTTSPSFPPYSYAWNAGTAAGTNDYVSTSGSYWITVMDANQCRKSFIPGKEVTVVQPPPAQIYGLLNYCIGEPVNLSGFVGTVATYEWLKNGSIDGTSYSVSDMDSPGSYLYQLILSVTDTASGLTCYDTGTSTINVYSLPPAPTITGPTIVDCSTYHLQLTASVPSPWSGVYNWSNGTTGAVNNIYSGGPYRVWFTDLWGCVSDTDAYVPLAPDTWFPYFPTGCYTLCQQLLPLTLYGPPDSTFNYWAWMENGDTVSSSYSSGYGSGSPMASYTIDSAGDYQWYLSNGLCGQMSDTFALSTMNCNKCQEDTFMVDTIVCNIDSPAMYNITLNLYSPGAGVSYTLGTDIGPIDPFSGTFSSFGWQPPMTLDFTFFGVPASDSVTITVIYTYPAGAQCVKKEEFLLPLCGWEAERNGHTGDSTTITSTNNTPRISTALLVFPNPASGDVTISYNYGAISNLNGGSLSIYDMMGRNVASVVPQEMNGSWSLNTANWVPGIYIIRMEGNGQALQTQRMVISH